MEHATSAEEVGLFAFKVWGYKQGELVSLLVHLGDRLGLFAAMPVGEPIDAVDLAAATGLAERWVQEWLRGMGAAELLDTTDGATFTLTPVARAVLVDDTDLA